MTGLSPGALWIATSELIEAQLGVQAARNFYYRGQRVAFLKGQCTLLAALTGRPDRAPAIRELVEKVVWAHGLGERDPSNTKLWDVVTNSLVFGLLTPGMLGPEEPQ